MTRIVQIIERTISLASGMTNAGINFQEMTASVVVMISDVVRHGKPLVGVALDSIGRYGHGALLGERFIPRVLAAKPESYQAEDGEGIDPFKLWTAIMANEKAGGHGERAGAVGLLDAAAWDLQAKIEEKPLWALLNERFPGASSPDRTAIYASGGHYRSGVGAAGLAEEITGYRRRGYDRFKIKAGGLPFEEDLERIETVIQALDGDASALSIDFNGGLSLHLAGRWIDAVDSFGLAWIEEPVDPLDYQLLAQLAQQCETSIGAGENLFSFAEARNLFRYGGLRPDRDYINIDISLSYGIVEYLRILDMMEAEAWKATSCVPHAGHLLSAHVAAGLGLGGHETAPSHALLGAYPDDYRVIDGYIQLSERPGSGVDAMPGLQPALSEMLPSSPISITQPCPGV